MDWLVILFLLISAAMSLIQKAAKEAGRAPRPPSPAPGPPPPPWLPPQVPAEGGAEAEEGISLEEGAGAAFEEGAASEEGVSMEGDFGEAEPAITPEVLHEREELERERLEFYAEAARLASVEGEEGLPAPSADEIDLPWKEEGDGESTGHTEGGGWLWTGEDLVRAVLAAEILGPPGGRWRLFASAGPGKEVDGA